MSSRKGNNSLGEKTSRKGQANTSAEKKKSGNKSAEVETCGGNELWMQSYRKIKEFQKKHDHCNVTKQDDPKLWRWVTRQRGERNQYLTVERRALLDDIGFEWSIPREMNGEVNWEMNFVTLEKFLKDGNPCSISKIERFDKTVGIWAANQRKRNQKGMLRTDRKERLEAIGFNFGESRKSRPQSLGRAQRDKWENMFQRLLEFKHENGHAVVPHKYEKDRALALWVSTQRREYNKKSWYGANRTMREDRRERLDAIGFVWDNLSNKKQARTESTKANSNDNRQTSTTSQVSPVDSSAGNSLPNTKNDSTIICIEV